jgi:general secretion pathway protein I
VNYSAFRRVPSGWHSAFRHSLWPSPSATQQSERGGFSLLEVILALAILTGAIAILGELARLGLQHAKAARDLTEAQLLCESKLAEIRSGILSPQPVQGVPIQEEYPPGEIPWLYSIELQQIDQDGLVAVRVTVTQDLPPERRPLSFSLTQWIPDPNLETSETTEQASNTTNNN